MPVRHAFDGGFLRHGGGLHPLNDTRSKWDVFFSESLRFSVSDLEGQPFLICKQPVHAFGCNPNFGIIKLLQHSSVAQRLQG